MAPRCRNTYLNAYHKGGLLSSSPLVQKDFVLLRSDWTVAKALKHLENIQSANVVVHRNIPKLNDYYYLFSEPEARSLLKKKSNYDILEQALDLHEGGAAPRFDMRSLQRTSAGRGIVLGDGNLVGFFDQSIGKGVVRRGHGPTRGATRGTSARSTLSTFYLVSDFPQEVQLNSSASLMISISLKDSARRALPIAIPKNAKVDVVVQPLSGFVLDGSGEGTLIASSEKETLPIQFKLKGIEVGLGRIQVFAFYDRQPLGSVKIESEVAPNARRASGQRNTAKTDLTPIAPADAQPDLSLFIIENQVNGGTALSFRLISRDPSLKLNFKLFGPVTIRMNPLEYFSEFFKGIEDLPIKSRQERLIAEQRLASKGTNLFSTVIPPDLQVLLWDLRDRIGSIWVQSEEPWIPWEMCKLKGEKNGRVVEGQFLCEGYSLTRWIPPIEVHPKLSAKNIGLVVPSDSGLPFAFEERDYIKSLQNKDRRIESVPANFLELTKKLSRGKHDVWHFTGHGGFSDPDPNRSGIILEKDEVLTPEDLSGAVENLGRTLHPLVFLNACQVGRGAMSLTDIGGMAAKFLRAGAGAFIGAHWSIYDKAALEFARAFYNELFSGVPIGKAAQKARSMIRYPGDPTWLAYTVFAHPFAAIA